MTTAVAENNDKPVARPLRVLVPLIKDDLAQAREASEQAGMPFFTAAGQKMIEARESAEMSVAELCTWSKRNFDLGRTQTLLYVSWAEHTTSNLSAGGAPTSLRQFRRDVLGHDTRDPPRMSAGGWREPVKANIEAARREAERIRDAELTRQQERDAERKLGLRLIEIGFKVLVKELHPDKGGSRDVMQRLNRVRDRLKQHA